MALNFPTLKQIIDRSRSDLRDALPKLQPSLLTSFVRAIVDSNSGRAYDMVVLLRQVLDQAFPQTAEGEYLDRWAGYNNLQQNPALSARGFVVLQGTVSTSLIAGTVFNSAAGVPYATLSDVNIALLTQDLVTAVADVNKLVTATTASPHTLASGITASITGLTDGASTASAVVTVVDEFTFSFTAPDASATGDVWSASAAYSFNGAAVEVQSSDAGRATNLATGEILTIVTPVIGISPNAFVGANGVLGGVDAETTEQLRARIISRRANPVANFNAAAIELQARLIPSVTRVYILPITPYPGAVTIYFFVGDTPSGIPTSTQIEDVKTSIVEIMPVTTDVQDVVVAAPNVVPVDIVIDQLVPNTIAMRDAIEANLRAYFEDQVDMGQLITRNALSLVVQNTQDTTGTFPDTFNLVTPASTVVLDSDEIAVFGSVSIS